eukprot:TRINITY_DN8539_c1_g1_i1.p1 TRINITY_DN8539_c1_g1~~TRINITY_DN8539_c1_g1_i1.p1  ORF type:complete len:449 (+),score=58.45 TRINITY_DN8539_c1_g1_i1:206-1552(+)
MPPYSVRVPAGKTAGSLVAVTADSSSGGGLRGYAQVPVYKAQDDVFEVTSDCGVLDFDAPGFPLFASRALDQGAYNDAFCPDGFTDAEWRRVRGRPCWMGCWAVTFLAGFAVAGVLAPAQRLLHMLAMYTLTFATCATFVITMWWEHKEEVQPGVLVAVFWTSGTVGIGAAALLNWCLLHIWPAIDPYCHPLHPLGKGWPDESPPLACIVKASIEWILMAGLVEETVKFFALLRLAPSPEVASQGLCCWRRRRSGSRWLAWEAALRSWWARLTPTPHALAIAALASGAGLATIENFHYIFFDLDAYERAMETGDLNHALGRIVSSCAHIVWTGFAGIHLAAWHFLPPGHPERPRYRWSGLIFPIICHGLFDMCSVLRTCYPEEHCLEWPPLSGEWVCGKCVLPPGPRFGVGLCFQLLFVGSGLLFHHRWLHTLLNLSVESSRYLFEAG